MAKTVSYIGIGNIGEGMAKNLAEKGPLAKPIQLYNRTHDRARLLASSLPHGSAVAVSSVAEAVADVDVVFLCLSTDDVVSDIVAAGLRASNAKGKIFVNCSTTTPETTTKLAKTVHDQGADYVACPVFGPPNEAATGELLVACAGPAPAVSSVLPLLTGVVARRTIDLSGQEPAKASLLKLISNTVAGNMIEATAEAMVLAEKTGLGAANLESLIKELWPGPCAYYAQRMAAGVYADGKPQASAEQGLSQIEPLIDLANSLGAKISATEIGVRHLRRVVDLQGAQGDVAGIYGAVREESGMQFGPDGEHT